MRHSAPPLPSKKLTLAERLVAQRLEEDENEKLGVQGTAFSPEDVPDDTSGLWTNLGTGNFGTNTGTKSGTKNAERCLR